MFHRTPIDPKIAVKVFRLILLLGPFLCMLPYLFSGFLTAWDRAGVEAIHFMVKVFPRIAPYFWIFGLLPTFVFSVYAFSRIRASVLPSYLEILFVALFLAISFSLLIAAVTSSVIESSSRTTYKILVQLIPDFLVASLFASFTLRAFISWFWREAVGDGAGDEKRP